MNEDQILQSIIADPDVVDPTIDVSQLRQTTPTSSRLLGGVTGIEGLKYDPTRTDYIRDLYKVYSGGLPTIDVAPVVDTTTPIVNTTTPTVDIIGGGDGTDQVAGSPVIDTTPTDINQEVVTQPSFDDIGTPIDIGFGEGQVDPRLAAGLEGPIIDTSPVTPTITASSGDVFAVDDPLAAEKIDFTPETQGLVDQAFSKVGSTASDIMNDLSRIPGAVADFTNQTVDIFGKKINVGKTLFNAGLNKIVGGPISLVFDALGAIQSDPIDAATKEGLEEKGYGFDDIGRLTDGPMAGYAVESVLGDGIADATLDRIDKIENRKAPQTEDSIEKVQELYDFLGDVTEIKAAETAPQEDIGAISGDLPSNENIVDEFKPSDIQVTNPSLEIPDRERGDGGNAATATATANEVAASNREAARSSQYGGGNGGDGGGGKIVCTMMNNSYGFGSFRNKIWLKHSKDMKPEYQIGYHKIFLPLVKLSKTNKVLKKTLEHIAVHRTIDIRQEARGKMHLLGRVYRKILEPICYLVGKYVK